MYVTVRCGLDTCSVPHRVTTLDTSIPHSGKRARAAKAGAMFAKAKAGAAAAAEATARSAKRKKLNGEIMLLQQKISKAKHDFGPHVYEAMLASINGPEVERLFNETRAKVDGLNAEIETKRAHIAALNEAGASHGEAVPPPGAPGGAAPLAAPPPAAPAPPGPATTGPPPGWKATKTAEGKEYYYNESTGETSWSLPVS